MKTKSRPLAHPAHPQFSLPRGNHFQFFQLDFMVFASILQNTCLCESLDMFIDLLVSFLPLKRPSWSLLSYCSLWLPSPLPSWDLPSPSSQGCPLLSSLWWSPCSLFLILFPPFGGAHLPVLSWEGATSH